MLLKYSNIHIFTNLEFHIGVSSSLYKIKRIISMGLSIHKSSSIKIISLGRYVLPKHAS
jgi:hypothetical protein